jgi:hypothetical protein
MVAGPDKSLYVTVHDSFLVALSYFILAMPLPLLVVAGTSSPALSLAENFIVSANAEPVSIPEMRNAAPTTAAFVFNVLPFMVLFLVS